MVFYCFWGEKATVYFLCAGNPPCRLRDHYCTSIAYLWLIGGFCVMREETPCAESYVNTTKSVWIRIFRYLHLYNNAAI